MHAGYLHVPIKGALVTLYSNLISDCSTGADVLEWWGFMTNAHKESTNNFSPCPLNRDHTHDHGLYYILEPVYNLTTILPL